MIKPSFDPSVFEGDDVNNLVDSLRTFGRNLAAGQTSPNAEDLAALRKHAATFARDAFRPAYDPRTYPDDAVQEENYRAALKDEELAEARHDVASKRLGERMDDLARLGAGVPKPEPEQPVVLTGISVLSISVAPTAFDQFFRGTIADAVLAWMAALGVGGSIGGLIVSLMVLSYAARHSAASNTVGLVAGILVGVAIGVIRLADATGSQAWIALGLTGIEIATVLYMRAYGEQLRKEYVAWAAHQERLGQASRLVDVAKGDVAECDAQHLDARRRADQHLAHLRSRDMRSRLDDLERRLLGALSDGYMQQVALNEATKRGVRREP